MSKLCQLLASVLLLSAPLLCQTIDDDLWKDAEDQIHDALAGRHPGFDQEFLVQLSNFPIYATWQLGADSQYALYMIANSVPKWSPKWVWQPGRRFDDGYGIFVDGLDVDAITNPHQDRQLKALADDWVAKRNRVKGEKERLENDWPKYLKKHPGSNKRVWWDDNSTQLAAWQVDANLAFAHYNSALPANARTVVNLIQRYAIALAQPVHVRLPASSGDAVADDSTSWPVADQLPFIGSDNELRRIVDDGDAAIAANKTTGWAIERGRSHHAEEHARWSGSVGWGGFFNLGGGGGNDKVTDQQHKFHIDFTTSQIGYLPVSPSPGWYSQFLVENFACGPFKHDISFNPNDLWKDGGSLSLLPSAILVAYKPSLTITLSDEDYTKLSSQVSGSGGFSVGPFSVGGGGSSVKTSEDKNSASKTITVAVTSKTPMIVAVLSTRLNPGKVCPNYPH